MRLFAISVILLSLAVSSCDKYKKYKKATVINTNNVSASGCGYIFQFEDGSEQKPQYLPSAYQHNNLRVKVKLKDAGSAVECSANTVTKWLPLVAVEDITRDLD